MSRDRPTVTEFIKTPAVGIMLGRSFWGDESICKVH